MGMDLLVSLVEIKRGKKPNFAKARAALLKLTPSETTYAVAMVTGEDEVSPDAALERITTALDSVEAGWNSQLRSMTKVCGLACDMLIAAGESWGADVEACNDVSIFAEAGLARIAGFMVKQVDTVPIRKQTKREHARRKELRALRALAVKARVEPATPGTSMPVGPACMRCGSVNPRHKCRG